MSDAKSILEKIGQLQAEKEQAQQKHIEDEAQYKDAINRLLSTSDGRYFARVLLKYTGMFSFDESRNQIQMVERNALRRMYIELVRKYLDNDVIQAIETR